MSDNRATELLPCPFCGGEAEIIQNDIGLFIGCFYEDCPIGPATSTYVDGYATEAEAIAAWNTRADAGYGAIPATDENMAKYGWVRERMCEITYKRGAMYDVARYSCCGYELATPVSEILPAENYCPNCGVKVVGE